VVGDRSRVGRVALGTVALARGPGCGRRSARGGELAFAAAEADRAAEAEVEFFTAKRGAVTKTVRINRRTLPVPMGGAPKIPDMTPLKAATATKLSGRVMGNAAYQIGVNANAGTAFNTVSGVRPEALA
jgi:hypothetical protein